MSKRLIYAEEIMDYLDNCCYYSDNPDYDVGYRNGIAVAWEKLLEAPGIDPVHAAGGCYCKECKHHEDKVYPDSEWELHDHLECWCNWCDSTMPLNGFCSEGRKDDTNNA